MTPCEFTPPYFLVLIIATYIRRHQMKKQIIFYFCYVKVLT